MGQLSRDQLAEATVVPTSGVSAHARGYSVLRQWWPGLLGLAILLLATAALAVDCPLALACRSAQRPKLLEELLLFLEMFELYGHALGPIVIALVIHQLDPARRWALPRLLTCAWGSGLVADGLKLLIVRIRPGSFHFQDGVWSTFGEWLPGISAGTAGQSLPSAHTATAAGLAMALAWFYPRGRILFAAMVVLVASQRIAVSAHYLSDVLCGAATGIMVAGGFLQPGRLPRLFERLENYLKPASDALSENPSPQ